MKIAPTAALLAAIGVVAGCSSSAPSPSPSATSPRSASELEPTGIPSQGGAMQLQEPTAGDKAKLEKLAKEYDAAKAALAKNPNDAKLKEHFSAIGALYGDESMKSPVLGTKVKYRQALRIFNEVLKVDPNNPVAKGESEYMIKIYKSMGRPVPKD